MRSDRRKGIDRRSRREWERDRRLSIDLWISMPFHAFFISCVSLFVVFSLSFVLVWERKGTAVFSLPSLFFYTDLQELSLSSLFPSHSRIHSPTPSPLIWPHVSYLLFIPLPSRHSHSHPFVPPLASVSQMDFYSYPWMVVYSTSLIRECSRISSLLGEVMGFSWNESHQLVRWTRVHGEWGEWWTREVKR